MTSRTRARFDQASLQQPVLLAALVRALLVMLFIILPADYWPSRLNSIPQLLFTALTLVVALILLAAAYERPRSWWLARIGLLLDTLGLVFWIMATGGIHSPLVPFCYLLPLVAVAVADGGWAATLAGALTVALVGFAARGLAPEAALAKVALQAPLMLLVGLAASYLGYRLSVEEARYLDASRVLETFQHQIGEARRAYQRLATGQLGACEGILLEAEVLPAAFSYGGDFLFSTSPGEGRLALMAFDVCGKRVTGATTGPLLRYALKAAQAASQKPEEQLAFLDELLEGELSHEQFVAATYVLMDHSERTVQVFNRGMPPAAVVSPGEVRLLAEIGPPLGIGGGVMEASRFVLAPGELLVIYSDGLLELLKEDEPLETLRELLLLADASCPEALLASLFERVQRAQVRRDDVSVAILGFND